jgi:hypothetical protein
VYCTASAKGCTSTTVTLNVPTPGGLWVAGTPSDVLTEGLTYQHRSWDAGLFNKTVGTQRLDDGAFHNEATISPYTLTNLFLNYTIRGNSRFNNTKLRLSFNNLFNEHNITGDSIATKITANTITANGTSYADPFNSNYTMVPPSGADAISIIPGRSVIVSATFGFSPFHRHLETPSLVPQTIPHSESLLVVAERIHPVRGLCIYPPVCHLPCRHPFVRQSAGICMSLTQPKQLKPALSPQSHSKSPCFAPLLPLVPLPSRDYPTKGMFTVG